MWYPVSIPKWLQYLFPQRTWRIAQPSSKKIYLTFDDGPIPEVTPWVLKQLKKYNAKATFFCVGANVEKNRPIYEQLILEGHAIGNHTYSHSNGWKTSTKDYLADVEKCQQLVASSLFRPPYGRLGYWQANAIMPNYQIIMWDVLAGDFDDSLTSQDVLDNILKNTKAGSIVVLHDSIKAKERLYDVLPKVLAHYSRLGFDFDILS